MEQSNNTLGHKDHPKSFWGDMTASRSRKATLVALVSVIGALLVFQAGVFVGYHKALFSYRGGERFFMMMEGGPKGYAAQAGIPSDDFGPSHGAVGRIVSVSLPTFVIAGPDKRERTVTIGDDTEIRLFRQTASTSEIRTDRFALVLGEPDQDGSIEARLVRIMPVPSAATTTNQ